METPKRRGISSSAASCASRVHLPPGGAGGPGAGRGRGGSTGRGRDPRPCSVGYLLRQSLPKPLGARLVRVRFGSPLRAQSVLGAPHPPASGEGRGEGPHWKVPEDRDQRDVARTSPFPRTPPALLPRFQQPGGSRCFPGTRRVRACVLSCRYGSKRPRLQREPPPLRAPPPPLGRAREPDPSGASP